MESAGPRERQWSRWTLGVNSWGPGPEGATWHYPMLPLSLNAKEVPGSVLPGWADCAGEARGLLRMRRPGATLHDVPARVILEACWLPALSAGLEKRPDSPERANTWLATRAAHKEEIASGYQRRARARASGTGPRDGPPGRCRAAHSEPSRPTCSAPAHTSLGRDTAAARAPGEGALVSEKARRTAGAPARVREPPQSRPSTWEPGGEGARHGNWEGGSECAKELQPSLGKNTTKARK